MRTADSTLPTLVETFWPAARSNAILRAALLVLAGTALLTLSAKIQVPFWPVPMTMQTLVVLLIGAVYGPRLGGATIAAYLAEGAVGLPVFAHGGGLAYMTGPTAGYLAGFLVAAVAVGLLAERGFDRRPMTAGLMFLVGEVIIFALGIAWLAGLFGFDKAIAGGLMPFLPAEAVKVALGLTLLPIVWKLIGRRR